MLIFLKKYGESEFLKDFLCLKKSGNFILDFENFSKNDSLFDNFVFQIVFTYIKYIINI